MAQVKNTNNKGTLSTIASNAKGDNVSPKKTKETKRTIKKTSEPPEGKSILKNAQTQSNPSQTSDFKSATSISKAEGAHTTTNTKKVPTSNAKSGSVPKPTKPQKSSSNSTKTSNKVTKKTAQIPKKDIPKKNIPKKDVAKKDVAKEDTSKKNVAKIDTPKKDVAKKGIPNKNAPSAKGSLKNDSIKKILPKKDTTTTQSVPVSKKRSAGSMGKTSVYSPRKVSKITNKSASESASKPVTK